MEKTISLAELEADPEAVAKDMRATGTVYWISRPGKPTVRLRQIPEWLAVIDMMGHPNWREDLEQSKRELAAVLAERDRGGPAKPARAGTTRRPAGNRRGANRRRSASARRRSA